ncbi:hypothetical protein [Vibrio sp. B1FLJ16]|uniref:hypothetical protein n=1 Tax=Vibrio sp. B1FLJ16 TaxID=2751178 RepID=UPI0015F52A0E|nr:hypothetical protein [Vibrio sp. B1FLJ16]CAD7817827.1 hypothetical protein ACOMICROBIO_EPCKBFOG_03250 [Vibrio sp. B1FLJ16]CAD7818879.1 hypothetical protein ACOMICROBIO_FLGHMIGD_03782 [Vibrio sp. B1FLJ16]CAE6932404.1 hypothetical protein ACOMICROBIO_EPCKBFOG_03250 [Vibrio sp. B1FLJ16]CAE6936482.1 hypothetical protein ACOMICROBIO_FLGHMIGD_03782 [Vibrio sp. B1FLJ16]
MPKISRLAFIGFGYTAQSILGLGLNRPDRVITAFDPLALEAKTCKEQLERYIVCGVQGCLSVSDAVNSAHLVLISDSSTDLNPWVNELEQLIKPGQIIADLRTPDKAKKRLKDGVENLKGIYIEGVLSRENNRFSIDSKQMSTLKDIFKSLDFFPSNMILNESN